jgi:uncharacterized protein YuzE
MRIEYDRRANAAYIMLKGDVRPGGVSRTVPCDPTLEMINLDFDREGHLVGIEVMDASKCLAPELLQTAVRIDKH